MGGASDGCRIMNWAPHFDDIIIEHRAFRGPGFSQPCSGPNFDPNNGDRRERKRGGTC